MVDLHAAGASALDPASASAAASGGTARSPLQVRLSREQLRNVTVDQLQNGTGALTVLPDIMALVRSYCEGDGNHVPQHERSTNSTTGLYLVTM